MINEEKKKTQKVLESMLLESLEDKNHIPVNRDFWINKRAALHAKLKTKKINKGFDGLLGNR